MKEIHIRRKLSVIVPAVILGIAAAAMSGQDIIYAKAEAASIDSATFPDDAFREYVLKSIDKDGDGMLSDDEAEAVTSISVSRKGIHSLEGIEFFKNLTSLECSGNRISSLDMSGNPLLGYLYCSSNRLTRLDVTGNPSLFSLQCYDNQLTILDVSQNPLLDDLQCNDNQLTSLDVSGCGRLYSLDCSGNRMSSIYMGDTIPYYFSCDDNSFSNGTLSFDAAELEGFDMSRAYNWENAVISGSVVTAEDPALPVTYNYGTGDYRDALFTFIPTGVMVVIDSATFPDDIFREYVNKNADQNGDGRLSEAEKSAVVELDVSGMSVSSLEGIENFKNLEYLDCSENRLTSLDVSQNTELGELQCYSNRLESLDVSANAALEYLDCSENNITSLDVSQNTDLIGLSCEDNCLGSLDVSANKALEELDCSGNKFSNGTLSFDTASLKGFDMSRAANWKNAVIEGTIVTAKNEDKIITYSYSCGNGYTGTFTFVPSAVSQSDDSENGTKTVGTGSRPPKPSLKGSVRGSTLTLRWKKQSGIRKIVIYRKTGKGSWRILKKVKATKTTCRISLKGYAKSVKYQFYIRTYYQSGKLKIWSKPSKKVTVRL